MGRYLPVSVDHEDMLGLGLPEAGDPFQQMIPVRVGAEAGKVLQAGPDGDLLAEELHALRSLQQLAAQGALSLEAHEEDCTFRTPEVVLQVVPDAARVAHAGGGDDDLGGPVLVQGLGLLAALRGVEVGEAEHVLALSHQPHRVVVHVAPKVPVKNGCGLFRQGRVDVNREVRAGVDQVLFLDFPDKIEELLGPAHGEGGDDDVSSPGHGLVDDPGQLVGIAPVLRMVPVAVGGLHHHVVRPGDLYRVADNGLVDVADVPGEDDAFFHAVLPQIHGHKGGAQQMSRVGKLHVHPLAEVDEFAVLADDHEVLDPLRVLHGVKGLGPGSAGALALAVFPLRVLLLNMGGVQQHDLQQLGGEAGGKNAALETLLDEHGNPAGVVNVGVGYQNVVNGIGGEGKFAVGDFVPALLEAAVDEDAVSVDLQTVAASGDALVRAVKAEFHSGALLIS